MAPFLNRAVNALLLGLLLLTLGQSVWLYKDGGRKEPEHQVSIPHYLSNRPLWQKIFDIKNTEVPRNATNFQARELSYLFDYWDVKWMAWGASVGHPHFLATWKYLFVLGIVLLGWWFFRSEWGMPRFSVFCLLMLFLTSAPVFHAGYFHRNAKIGVAFTAFCYLLWSYRFLLKSKSSRWRAVPGFFLMLATCFFDMQGFYLVVINTVALSYWNWRHPSILRRYLLEMSAAAAGIHALYRYVFGFWWLSLLNGYEVRGAYHELPWAGLKAVTSVDLFMSAHLFLDYFRFFFGSLSVFWALGAFLLLAGTGGAGLLQKRRDWLLLWGFVGLSLVTMLFLMGVKFDYIYAHHIRRIYYSLPMTALFLVFSAWNLSHFAKRFPKANAAVGLVLVALVFHNLAILPQHKALLDKTGEGSSRNREDILAAMRAIHDPFAPVPESVARNLIYRSLKAAALNQPVPPVEAPDETPTR